MDQPDLTTPKQMDAEEYAQQRALLDDFSLYLPGLRRTRLDHNGEEVEGVAPNRLAVLLEIDRDARGVAYKWLAGTRPVSRSALRLMLRHALDKALHPACPGQGPPSGAGAGAGQGAGGRAAGAGRSARRGSRSTAPSPTLVAPLHRSSSQCATVPLLLIVGRDCPRVNVSLEVDQTAYML